MHIMEGFLPLEWAVFWYVVCVPFVWLGLRDIERLFKEHPEQKLTLAVAGAFIFVLSSLKLPSVTGSSSHPTGTGLSTVLFGFSATSVLAVIVLVFQALLLAHGGITTLGADLFSMGIFGPLVAWGVFQLMRRAKIGLGPSVFLAAVLSDWATYLVTSVQLALAYPAGGALTSAGVMGSFAIFAGVFAITQIPLAIVEGLLLWVFFDYLSKSRPKLVAQLLGNLA